MRLLAVLAALLLGLAAPAFAETEDRDRFTVEVRGAGPDAILIPGLASSRAVWDDTARALEGRYRLHLVQVKGFAGEPAGANAEGPVLAPLVEALAAYVAEAKLERPAVIGHSMGGETALALAARRPEAVGRVMVVDALPFYSLLFGPQTTPQSARPQAAALRDGMLAQTPEQFEAGQKRIMAYMTKTPAGRELAVRWSVESDRSVIGRAMHELMVTDLRPELASIKAPVTVLYAYDPSMMFPQATMEALYANAYAGLPGAKLVRVDGAYHFLMWDQPERFRAEVERFLGE